jgi:GNAT superfamily N-acetyltransferase
MYLLKRLASLIFSIERYAFFEYDRSIEGKEDEFLTVYTTYSEIPKQIRPQLFRTKFYNTMLRRIKKGQASVICLIYHADLIAYGWIQSWKPFRRRFASLSDDAIMLGPYWTKPEFRGKGIYKRLLKHSMSLNREREKNLLIFAQPENHSSIAGIRSVGFKYIGEFRRVNILGLGFMKQTGTTNTDNPDHSG